MRLFFPFSSSSRCGVRRHRVRPAHVPRMLPALAVMAAALVLTSCSPELPPTAPLYGVGAVEGRVLAAGRGLSVKLEARAQEGADRGRTMASTQSDSTGWYRMELPSGLYRLEFNRMDERVMASDLRDTVRVGREVQRHDLLRGQADIRIQMPAEWDGRRITMRMDDPAFGDMHANGTVRDGQADFTFPGIQPGSYVMLLIRSGDFGGTYLPGTADQTLADVLVVGTEHAVSYQTDLNGMHASISGRVTGSWQVAGPESFVVTAVGTDARTIVRDLCADDGSFTLHFFAPQEIRLQLEYRGVTQWFEGDTFETARVFDVRPGNHATGIEVVESGMEISFAGLDDVMNYRADVLVRDASGNEYRPFQMHSSPLTVCNLRPGRYYLYLDGLCSDQTWLSRWYQGSESFDGATPIDLGVGEMRRLVFDMVEGGRISGTILTADGARPRSVPCSLTRADGQGVCPWSEYSGAGVFTFTGLADGEYYLRANAGGLGTWWYPGTVVFAEATPFIVVDHAALTGVVWTLPAPMGAVQP